MKKPRARERVWLRRVWLIVCPEGWQGDAFLTRAAAVRKLRELEDTPFDGGWAGARVVQYRVVEQAKERGVKG